MKVILLIILLGLFNWLVIAGFLVQQAEIKYLQEIVKIQYKINIDVQKTLTRHEATIALLKNGFYQNNGR